MWHIDIGTEKKSSDDELLAAVAMRSSSTENNSQKKQYIQSGENSPTRKGSSSCPISPNRILDPKFSGGLPWSASQWLLENIPFVGLLTVGVYYAGGYSWKCFGPHAQKIWGDVLGKVGEIMEKTQMNVPEGLKGIAVAFQKSIGEKISASPWLSEKTERIVAKVRGSDYLSFGLLYTVVSDIWHRFLARWLGFAPSGCPRSGDEYW